MDIYEEVARDLYVEHNLLYQDSSDLTRDRFESRWSVLQDESQAPYRAAAERLVNKYQERFLGEEPSQWWPDGSVDEALNEPAPKEGEGTFDPYADFRVLSRTTTTTTVTETVEGRV